MNQIVQIKNQINSRYFNLLKMMENKGEVDEVRMSLLDISSNLQNLSLLSPIDKQKASERAKQFLLLAKKVREDKAYDGVYFSLTGKKHPTVEIKDNLDKKIDDKIDEVKKDQLVKKDQQDDKDEPVVGKSYHFNWNVVSDVSFDDVAGLEKVKEEVRNKVVLPLTHPELFEGYEKTNGGGLLLYGPPGTGKTMIGAAIANEMKAKFCCITPSELLTVGVGNTEKLIKKLFEEARSFDVAIIYFEEIESFCPKSTHSQIARQFRSELLTQIQGMSSYNKDTGKILYLIASTNKPWDIDPAFIRPGRFGTRVYVDLPDDDARRYLIEKRLEKIKANALVEVEDINVNDIVERTKGYSGADMSFLLDEVQELSIKRAIAEGYKIIKVTDFEDALVKVTSSIQQDDVDKLLTWKEENNG